MNTPNEIVDLAWLDDCLLFGPALLTGLGFALYLPILGCYLRLRHEILASLAYAQVGAAGALGAMGLGISLHAGGMLSALLVASAKHQIADAPTSSSSPTRRNTLYALVLVLAWAASVLMTSNFPLAERLGHALFDGQLLLSGGEFPWLMLGTSCCGILVLRWLSNSLLLAQLFPDIWRLRSAQWRWLHWAFDVLAAISITAATMNLGIMASFALLLILPWQVFEQGPNWQHACRRAMGTSLIAYLLAFGLALVWDQPFGPIMVLTLSMTALTQYYASKPRQEN